MIFQCPAPHKKTGRSQLCYAHSYYESMTQKWYFPRLNESYAPIIDAEKKQEKKHPSNPGTVWLARRRKDAVVFNAFKTRYVIVPFSLIASRLSCVKHFLVRPVEVSCRHPSLISERLSVMPGVTTSAGGAIAGCTSMILFARFRIAFAQRRLRPQRT